MQTGENQYNQYDKNYGELDDSDGLIGGFFLNLALPMVEAKWQAYLIGLKNTYARRPSLQSELKKL